MEEKLEDVIQERDAARALNQKYRDCIEEVRNILTEEQNKYEGFSKEWLAIYRLADKIWKVTSRI